MSGYFVLLAISVAVALAMLAYAVFRLGQIERPTRGKKKIDSSGMTGEALVVIDVQEDFTRHAGKSAYDETVRDAVLARINARVCAYEAKGFPVIYVRQAFRNWPARLAVFLTNGGLGNAGRPGNRLDRDLKVVGEIEFFKEIGDAFSNPDFERYLHAKKIGELELVGLDGIYCLASTARGARNRGFKVTLDVAAILTGYPDKWADVKDNLMADGVDILAAGRPT